MNQRKINKIVIHCTDSPDSMDIGFREINEWHQKRGFLDKHTNISCGYHYIIRRDGKVETGRPESSSGAHVAGHNSNSIGVVWVGRTHLSPAQDKALLATVRDLLARYKLDASAVVGHKELDPNKTCPNINMDKFRIDLLFPGLDSV